MEYRIKCYAPSILFLFLLQTLLNKTNTHKKYDYFVKNQTNCKKLSTTLSQHHAVAYD